MSMAACAECNYPISAPRIAGKQITCPMCSTINEVTGVEIPTPIFAGGIGFLLGIFIGPALIASSDWGRHWLEKKARGG